MYHVEHVYILSWPIIELVPFYELSSTISKVVLPLIHIQNYTTKFRTSNFFDVGFFCGSVGDSYIVFLPLL